jgi:FG-GAP-like repeat/Divergent InlB B-repeat domain
MSGLELIKRIPKSKVLFVLVADNSDNLFARGVRMFKFMRAIEMSECLCSAPIRLHAFRRPLFLVLLEGPTVVRFLSMRTLSIMLSLAVLLCLLLQTRAYAAPLSAPVLAVGQNILQESGEVTAGATTYTVVRYTWRDSAGKPRSVSLVPGSASTAGFAVQMTYVVSDGGVERTAYINATAAGHGGFGYFVSHELVRQLDNGGYSTIAGLHGDDDSPLGRFLPSTGSDQSVGSNQATHEYRFNYHHWGTIAAVPDPSSTPSSADTAQHQLFSQLPVIIRWHFVSGQDYPVWSVDYDISSASDRISIDVRGPYGAMVFNENTGPLITALRWGDKYRFEADAGVAEIGATAAPANGLSWTWNVLNSGRRYNVLGAAAYEFGIVETVPYAASRYGDIYAAPHRGSTKTLVGGCAADPTYQLLSMPCNYEWPYQSFQYIFNDPTADPRLAWGSSPFLGSSITTVFMNDTETETIVPQGRIHYGTHIVFGRSGTGTPLALAKANAPVESNPTLTTSPNPVSGGSISYTVLGSAAASSVVSPQVLTPWDSVKLTAMPNAGFNFTTWTGACAGVVGPVCMVAMNQSQTVGATFVSGGAAPANDNFANRQVISGAIVTVTGSNMFATGEVGEPVHYIGSGNANHKSVWYSYTATETGVAYANTSGSTFDTVLAAYSGSPNFGSLTQLASNDDTGGLNTSAVTFRTIIGQNYYVVVDGYAGAGGDFTLNVGPVRSSDLSADSKSDLIFNNTSTGEIAAWLMNGPSVTSAALLLGPGAWTTTHTADLNADGKADILLRNNSDGAVVLWLMNGLGVTSGTTLLSAGSGWSISHTGDFNGDGKADILLRHTDGRIVLWLMNGSTVSSGTSLLPAGTGYSGVHVADFNGDGKADILLRNTSDGTLVLWTMNGGAVTTGTTLLSPNSGYTPTHTGDFNGDGKADILLRNNANGSIVAWLMNGATVTSGTTLIGASNWYVNQVADFNGDGKSDILLRNADGTIVAWLMNGSTVSSGSTLFGPTTAWAPTKTGDYNGDGKADIIMRNNDGTLVMWLMNGGAITSGNTILGPGFWNVGPQP